MKIQGTKIDTQCKECEKEIQEDMEVKRDKLIEEAEQRDRCEVDDD